MAESNAAHPTTVRPGKALDSTDTKEPIDTPGNAANLASLATPAAPRVNAKDSMSSTWRTDKSQWGFFHWLYEIFGLHPDDLVSKVPVHQKTDPVPYMPGWMLHRWILTHAFIPLAIHQAFVSYTGIEPHPAAVIGFYAIAFDLIGIHQLNVLRGLGNIYGFLDGDKHARDGVPDLRVRQVLLSLLSTVTFRMLFSVLLSYDRTKSPLQMDWLALPLEIGLYGIVLDFWFYWYHRAMHDTNALWKFHRTHHLTKHPNGLLSLYADTEQEIFDIVGIPLATYFSLRLMGLPMGFYEWWVCHMYVVFAELTGHSGLRVHSHVPSTNTWLLKALNMELLIEDHDLHHRQGWKKSYNYGKQTRVWDKLFGTCGKRIEDVKGNVDYNKPAYWPAW